MRTPHPTQRVIASAVVGWAVIALFGCSGGSASSPTSASTGSTAASTSILPPTSPTTSRSPSFPSSSVAVVPSSTAAPTAPAVSPGSATATLPPVPDQRAAVGYDHPNLGPVTISLAYPEPKDGELLVPTIRAAVNATGETVYEWTNDDGFYDFGFAGTRLNPTITDPVDARGHVFFEWDPGRFPGISYLVPTATGFDSNGTLTDSYGDGHYVANVVDSDGDGNYEIEQGFQVCTTSCADGYIYSHVWVWDGTAYTGSDVDPNLDPDEAAQRAAAEQAFTDYLLAAGAREYERAWAMLTTSYQVQYGGFEEFTKFWDGIASVGTNWIDARQVDDPPIANAVTYLDVDIWFETTDGTRQREMVRVTMTSDDPPKIYDYTYAGQE